MSTFHSYSLTNTFSPIFIQLPPSDSTTARKALDNSLLLLHFQLTSNNMSSDEAELQAQRDQEDLEKRAKQAFPDLDFDESEKEGHTPPPRRQPRDQASAGSSQRSRHRRRSPGSSSRSTKRSTGGATPKKTTLDRPPTSKQTTTSTSGSGKSRTRSPQTSTAGKRQRTDSNTTAPKPKTTLLDVSLLSFPVSVLLLLHADCIYVVSIYYGVQCCSIL